MIRLACLVMVVFSMTATQSAAQTPTMPSTLRYGSGLLDVPVSSVLPHLNVTATFSGFWNSLGRRIEIDEAGQPSGFGPARSDFFGDFSTAVGLFDRAEAGVTIVGKIIKRAEGSLDAGTGEVQWRIPSSTTKVAVGMPSVFEFLAAGGDKLGMTV